MTDEQLAAIRERTERLARVRGGTTVDFGEIIRDRIALLAEVDRLRAIDADELVSPTLANQVALAWASGDPRGIQAAGSLAIGNTIRFFFRAADGHEWSVPVVVPDVIGRADLESVLRAAFERAAAEPREAIEPDPEMPSTPADGPVKFREFL